jgi:hypothetical protein
VNSRGGGSEREPNARNRLVGPERDVVPRYVNDAPTERFETSDATAVPLPSETIPVPLEAVGLDGEESTRPRKVQSEAFDAMLRHVWMQTVLAKQPSEAHFELRLLRPVVDSPQEIPNRRRSGSPWSTERLRSTRKHGFRSEAVPTSNFERLLERLAVERGCEIQDRARRRGARQSVDLEAVTPFHQRGTVKKQIVGAAPDRVRRSDVEAIVSADWKS